MVETAPRPVVLGVERSITGRRWESREIAPRDGLAIAQRLGLPELVGRLIASRGIAVEDAGAFLDPQLRRDLPDPSHLIDLDRAVERLVTALSRRERIVIFGDYDVDGATSTALLQRFLTAVGGEVGTYIPDRMTEGYGPNAPALQRLAAEGARVVVTVDCGATAHAPLAAAVAAGLDVIVCDHHVGEPDLPPAWAVVNPNRFDETSPHRQMAAVGVAFLLAVGLNRALRTAGWYRTRPEPDLLGLLDLVALGTVCDVVPLVGVNRALVAQGLKVLRRRETVGIASLCDVARVNERPDAFHLGYLLGPRVNAGGRVGDAGLGAQLLTTEDPEQAKQIAQRLDQLNEERRGLEAAVLLAAEEAVRTDTARPLAFAAGEGWHPGVIGIVATRLKDRFHRPAFVVAVEGGIAKGSGRSVPGFAMGEAVIAARQAGLLVSGGGHAMAAGFTAEAAHLPALAAFLEERVVAAIGAEPLQPRLGIDGALEVQGASAEMMALIDRIGPFGAGNAEPRFAIPAARIVKADQVGQNHVRCILAGPAGGRLKAIAFRALDSELGPALLQTSGGRLHLAGHLRPDTWAGADAVQLVVEDAAFPS
ncbi:MAG: single-stranded-DNA-specific exonuclease RecJ [Alphaproteobacteria bacterium]|nr:single-stranded-DNA-specific exonuclease RecJ [Alphaproteobacteria bacterium]